MHNTTLQTQHIASSEVLFNYMVWNGVIAFDMVKNDQIFAHRGQTQVDYMFIIPCQALGFVYKGESRHLGILMATMQVTKGSEGTSKTQHI